MLFAALFLIVLLLGKEDGGHLTGFEGNLLEEVVHHVEHGQKLHRHIVKHNSAILCIIVDCLDVRHHVGRIIAVHEAEFSLDTSEAVALEFGSFHKYVCLMGLQ